MAPELSSRLLKAKREAIKRKLSPQIILEFVAACSSIGRFGDLSAKWQDFVKKMESRD